MSGATIKTSSSGKFTFSGKSTSTVLASGGALSGGDRSTPLTVDKCQAQRVFKKPVGKGSDGALDSFNMFKPLSVNSTARGGRKVGDPKTVHTDPFAEDRPHYQAPVKKLLEVKRDQPAAAATRKHVTSVVQDGQDKEKVITANGMIGGGGRNCGNGNSSSTTFDKPLGPTKNYASMSRFKLASAARQDSIDVGPISPNTGDLSTKKFPKNNRNPATGGTKRVDSAPDTANSLVGVLRMPAKTQGRSYTYRPPWGTCNTPRTPAPSNNGQSNSATPWAPNA